MEVEGAVPHLPLPLFLSNDELYQAYELEATTKASGGAWVVKDGRGGT
jgi:hypothetical protein